MNRTSARWLVAMGILVVIWVAWRSWPSLDSQDARTSTSGKSDGTTRGPTLEARERPAPVARLDPHAGPRTLPPPGGIEELAAKAGAGDAVAACQLSAELAACRTEEELRRNEDYAAKNPETPRCTLLLEHHADRHFDYLRQAAHAGEPEAMLRYAQGEGFGIAGASYAYLRSPQFDIWRREAPGMLESVINAGYLEAVVFRMLAKDPVFGGPLASVIPPDPVEDQAYAELFLLLHAEATQEERQYLRASTDAVVLEQARQLAARWHQDYFGGRSYQASEMMPGNGYPVMQAHGANCSVAIGKDAP